ncbi:MAG: cupredoxin domain-containing protein [Dehalococcoidia bacterium]
MHDQTTPATSIRASSAAPPPRATRRLRRAAGGAGALAALALVLGACNQESADSDGVLDEGARDPVAPSSEADLEMVDVDYLLKEIDGTAGEEVTVHLKNTGESEHTFNVDAMPVDSLTPSSAGEPSGATSEEDVGDSTVHVRLAAGAEERVVFVPSEAGEYAFYCTVPGHREAGMEGTISISAS